MLLENGIAVSVLDSSSLLTITSGGLLILGLLSFKARPDTWLDRQRLTARFAVVLNLVALWVSFASSVVVIVEDSGVKLNYRLGQLLGSCAFKMQNGASEQ